jgi:hypothetical protein
MPAGNPAGYSEAGVLTRQPSGRVPVVLRGPVPPSHPRLGFVAGFGPMIFSPVESERADANSTLHSDALTLKFQTKKAGADKAFVRFPATATEFFKRQKRHAAALLHLGPDLAMCEIVDLRVRHQLELSAIPQPAFVEELIVFAGRKLFNEAADCLGTVLVVAEPQYSPARPFRVADVS